MYNDTAAREGFAAALEAMSHTQDLSENLCSQTRVLVIVITILATIFVVMRFLGRYKHGMRLDADDWTCLVALVLLYANSVVHIVLISLGVGMHTSALSLDQVESLSKVLFAGEILYVTSINTYKISLLFFYWRTFPVRLVKVGGVALGLFTLIWAVAAIFVIAFQCLPVSKAWQPWAQGLCTDLLHTEPAMAGLNIFCDVAILCLPIRPVMSLKIDTAQKSFVIGTFLLGSYVCFTSCYRLAMFFKFDPNDPTYTLAEGQAWDVVEMASGIISCCLPTLGPILKTMTNSVLTSTRFSRRMSAMRPARMSDGPKHDLNLVTIGGSGSSCQGSRSPRSPRSPHWSLRDKYGTIDDTIDDADEEGLVAVDLARPSPQRPPSTPPTADIVVTRKVAMLMRNGASVSIARSLEDESPLRTHRLSSMV